MRTHLLAALTAAAVAASAAPHAQAPAHPRAAELAQWGIHDMTRPMAPVVDPGPAGPPAPVPADAVVLFDGTSLKEWVTTKGAPVTWAVRNGYMEVVKGAGSIQTVRASPAVGENQDRGNSGVFLMNTYEVQVLDSYQAKTYADGQAGALYGQFPPLVNATRRPGEWQTYDIIFRAPRFAGDGTLQAPARMTVLHNGVLIHNNEELTGPTAHKARPPYKAHAARLPIGLQDHSHPVRFRNIWIRDLSK
jgi:hypothetical protein